MSPKIGVLLGRWIIRRARSPVSGVVGGLDHEGG